MSTDPVARPTAGGPQPPPQSGRRYTPERLVQGAFAFALALLAGIGAISYANAARQEAHDAWVVDSQAVIAELRSLLSSVTDVETGQRGFVIVGDDKFLEPHVLAEASLKERIDTLRRLTAEDAPQRRRLEVLAPLVAERVALSNEVVRLRSELGFDAARAAVASGRGNDVHDRIRRLVADMEGLAETQLRSREAAARTASVRTRMGIVAGAAFGFLALSIALVVIGRGFAEIRRGDAELREANERLEARVRQRTEDLARSQENLRVLVQQAPICIAMFDREMRYLATSGRWVVVYGRGRDDLIGLGHYDVHPDLPEEWKLVHRRGLAGEIVRNDEDSWVQADGTRQWLRWAVHPWRDDQGQIGGIIISSEDITPRKQAEAALRAGEERLHFALESVGVGAWDLDLVDHTAHRSLGHDRIFGYDALLPEWTYEMFLQHVLPEDRPEVDRRFREAVAAQGDWSFDCRIRRADERVRWIWAAGRHRLDENGKARRMAGVVQDITERKEAEEAIRTLNTELEQRVAARTAELGEALSRARDLYEEAPCGYHSLDEAGRFLDVNRTEAKWLGYAKDDLIGRLFTDFLAPSSVATFQQNFARFRHTGSVKDLEFDLVRQDGSVLPVLLSGTLLRDAEGRFLRTRSAMVDMSDLRQAREKLVSANRELETFTYSVSHDLKAPLRGIDGYSRLLLQDYGDKLDEEGRLFVENVRRGVQQMGRLIDDLLAYSRVERRAMQVAALRPAELVRELLAERDEELRARKVDLSVELPPDAAVLADRDGLAMAFRNLLDNALKFTRDVAKPAIAITAKGGPETFTIRVSDNGVGFDMKFHDRIFEIFQRLHRSEDFPGTGVGLAIVRKAMERMGGRVWAESEPGRGAEFFVELPR